MIGKPAIFVGLLLPGIVLADPVKVDGGLLSRRVENGWTAYRGVPYAAPPLGGLRWKAPQRSMSNSPGDGMDLSNSRETETTKLRVRRRGPMRGRVEYGHRTTCDFYQEKENNQ